MNDEPLFVLLREDDSEYLQTINEARRTLPEFRRLIVVSQSTGAVPCIKTQITDGNESAPMWLSGAKVHGNNITATVFEVPPEFPNYRVGDRIEVHDSDVLDWMVNDQGVLRGGFSLRYQRATLPNEKRAWFDNYIGVSSYE